ncbi:hypothetical protein FJR48_11080 [Sulfurimonas lithotrophica]|uniref:Uncharacterized protein n=1 Tax=Sulfurimonas lithotrophica TaxID=2590022 RepID=A0A5P8P3D3_9BACT|nr:hypothetical protein [Sulfurimonas lithotrophica]QFR50242.1 hypothetical protein FJR48_11080 [Sulfurimonas lithotrophica]
MNEMYSMSIVAHNYSVLAVLLVIGVNFYKLFSAKSVQEYRKFTMLFNPIVGTMIGAVLFTGVIMMAAKHLSFTLENIVMIVYGIVLIVLEAKRAKTFKYVLNSDKEGFLLFKEKAKKIFALEFIGTLIIYIWMVSIAK